MSSDKTTKIIKKYVRVEMIRQEKDKFDVISGLFIGIIHRNKDIFILLSGVDNTTNVLNLDFYSIMSIEVLESTLESLKTAVDDKKYLTVFTHKINDQSKAIDSIEEIFSSLLLADMALKNDAGIIDISKYIDVPNQYKNVNTVSATKSGNISDTATKTMYPTTKHQNNNTSFSVYKKVESKTTPAPKLFKRGKTDKKPTKVELTTLIKKLDLILNGDFKPILPDTTKMDEQEDTTKDIDYADMCGRNYCGY